LEFLPLNLDGVESKSDNFFIARYDYLARTAAARIAIASSADRLTTAYASSSRGVKLTFGDVKLDGVKYGFAGEFTQKIIGEPVKRSFVAYYIDSGSRRPASVRGIQQ
jgi:hypothetical protein